ncbi:hypothetical protein NEOKW01_1146 [Nematocida sp. AWRm80]|nr:hypothetical protein NEOKW01_1146 [Nematocida sp. AWRm80]
MNILYTLLLSVLVEYLRPIRTSSIDAVASTSADSSVYNTFGTNIILNRRIDNKSLDSFHINSTEDLATNRTYTIVEVPIYKSHQKKQELNLNEVPSTQTNNAFPIENPIENLEINESSSEISNTKRNALSTEYKDISLLAQKDIKIALRPNKKKQKYKMISRTKLKIDLDTLDKYNPNTQQTLIQPKLTKQLKHWHSMFYNIRVSPTKVLKKFKGKKITTLLYFLSIMRILNDTPLKLENITDLDHISAKTINWMVKYALKLDDVNDMLSNCKDSKIQSTIDKKNRLIELIPVLNKSRTDIKEKIFKEESKIASNTKESVENMLNYIYLNDVKETQEKIDTIDKNASKKSVIEVAEETWWNIHLKALTAKLACETVILMNNLNVLTDAIYWNVPNTILPYINYFIDAYIIKTPEYINAKARTEQYFTTMTYFTLPNLINQYTLFTGKELYSVFTKKGKDILIRSNIPTTNTNKHTIQEFPILWNKIHRILINLQQMKR